MFFLFPARAGVDSIFVTWAPPPRNQNIKIRGYKLAWGEGIPDVFSQSLGEQSRHFTIRDLCMCILIIL